MNLMKTFLSGSLAMLLTGSVVQAADKKIDYQAELQTVMGKVTFQPPDESAMPSGEHGRMIKLGKDIFTNTQTYASEHVGNGLNCSNCHLDNGRRAFSAPLWGAMGIYPKYRKKNDMVNTIQARMQGCFTYSMDGTPPAADSEVMTALVTYGFWLAEGAPIGKNLPGRGYMKLAKPAQQPSYERGEKVYRENCALCHGDQGQGTKVDGKYHFPPLWGPDSFNWGAGMHRVNTAAGFIKMNMPYGKGGSLTDQQAWDVAMYMNSQERPQDPRIASVNGDINKLDASYHKHSCSHGDKKDGEILGTGIPHK